jgi:nitrite reductase/ring-hydroxylating ferredoxin subunit
MAEFIPLGSISEFSEDTMKTIRAGGKKVAVACVMGQFFVIDDTCSHANCSLGTSGFLDGTAVICGCHGAQFDMTTGDVLTPPASSSVASYETEVRDNVLYIKV